jgi:tetratricopeptide (TPR) repeat protein
LIRAAPAKSGDAETAIDPKTAAQLKALGYIAAAPTNALVDEVALLELKGDDPTSKVPDMLLLAVASGYYRFNLFEDAAKTFRELVERNPESVPLLQWLDHVLKRLGQDDERFDLLSRMIARAPENSTPYVELAHINVKRGNQARAEKLLVQALEINPCLESPRANLAHLAAQRGDRAGQLRLLKEGVEHCAFSAGLHNSYAYLLATAPDEKHRSGPEALRIAQRVTREMSEPQPNFLDTLAAAYAEVGDFANAVSVQKRALRLIETAGDAEQIQDARNHLAQFEAGRPVREN